MADHDLFIKYDETAQHYAAKRLKATFFDRGTLRIKYDDSEQYWREFVGRWWHHDNLNFFPVILTIEQQTRLNEINAQTIDTRYLYEVSNYVQFGAVTAETTEPYFMTLATDPTIVTARLEKRREELRRALESYRYDVETGNITLDNGMVVLTDRDAQAQLGTTFTTLKEGMVATIRWKAPTGWSDVTLASITPIATACATHVQMCFASESDVDLALTAEVDEAVLLAFDVKEQFDTALLDRQTAV